MSQESIDGIIKSCRDIMRKDKGMNTDAQRLPQLLWMLFLKCFDDFEQEKEDLGEKTIIKKPFRWRDYSDEENGPRGEELIEFVEDKLFPYLQGLHGKERRNQLDVIADIFEQQRNYMTNGYGMKEMINQINKLDFTSSKQYHLIGSVYEKLLLAMRDDSSGTFGEFYTPRPVIKFIVNMINPSLEKRETIMDPACGTSGFLIESYTHLEEQVKGNTDKNEFLLNECLFGIEPRPDPFLFGLMNMMLHGIPEPNIERVNTLETPPRDIPESTKVNIIMTNPPFGGEEQDSIKRKFPAGYQTKDTALGFLLHCIARTHDDGRCAIILPNGPLFATGIASKIKQKLLEECNLHTIIRLPQTVFEPYTTIATNILFFDKSQPTKEIWYYQMNVPERLRGASRAKNPKFTKSNPILYEDFTEIIKWNKNKQSNQNAWKVSVEDIDDFNLALKNPNENKEILNFTPHELIDNILKDEERTIELLKEIKELIQKEIPK